MLGYRKFIVALSAIASATGAVGMGWVEGVQYASVVTLVVGTYCAANTMAKKA